MRHTDDEECPGELAENNGEEDEAALRVDKSVSMSSLKAGGRSRRNCVTSPSKEAASSIVADSASEESVTGSLNVRFLTLLTI